MALVFTCKECDTRIAKKITKQAYEKGVVIIECPGCHARHLIADNLGWYKDWTDDGKLKNVEEFAERNGEVVRRVSSADISLDSTGLT